MTDELGPGELAQLDRIGAASREHGAHMAACYRAMRSGGMPDDLAADLTREWQAHLLDRPVIEACDCEDDDG